MSTHCQEAAEEAAVALLTRRPVSAATAEHLRACPGCRAEWEQLSALPELLATAGTARAEREPPPGPDLLGRLLAEAARSRRRRRIGVAAAAAAAVVALAVPVGIWLGAGRAPGDDGPGTSQSAPPSAVLAQGSATAAGSGVHADVEIRATAWGSDVGVAAEGLTPGMACQIVVVDRSGRSETAGSWRVSGEYHPGRSVHETVHTAPAQISHVELVDEATGRRLLTVPVT